MQTHERYNAIALQTLCDAVNQDATPEAAHERMNNAIDRITAQIATAKIFFEGYNGYPVKLFVLPEYWMTGFPMGEKREVWKKKAAIDIDGPISDRLGGLAQKFKIYLCSNHYENDPHFPNLYFQANIVYGPNGNTILRYRRMISLYTPSPYDVWDQYLDIYGANAIFPTVDSEIGTLATIASEEILYPEIARAHSLKGAEILLHPTSEIASPMLTPKDISKRARALENMTYLVSANTGTVIGNPIPANSIDFMSKIVDWKGQVLAEAAGGETMNACAVLDLASLRSARKNAGMSHFLSRLPMQAFEGIYQSSFAPPNRSIDGEMIEKNEAEKQQRAVIDSLNKAGIIK